MVWEHGKDGKLLGGEGEVRRDVTRTRLRARRAAALMPWCLEA
jgi:hypothetical protein